ncbi:AMP-binding protein [Candidatus Woesearchaeota archaeon]|nr:AMP-binding protein [Candidatus Woesearchaeota archaeon]
MLHKPLTSWQYLQKMSERKQKRLQNEKLRQMMRLFPLASYYHSLFDVHKIPFKHIKQTKDLGIAQIPFTTKQDIVTTMEHPEKAAAFVLDPKKNLRLLPKLTTLKLFFSKKLKEELTEEFKPIHVHFTTGRSAMSIPVLYTKYDLENLREAGKRMMSLLKIPNDVRVINVFPFAPHLAFWQTVYATNENNIFGLHTGGGRSMGSEKILQTMERMKAEAIIGMPSYVYHLLSIAQEKHIDLHSVRYVLLGGEAVPPGYRQKIKELLCLNGAPADVKIYTTYGFTEGKIAWTQCHEESGYHLYPDMEYIEIIDAEGNPVADGESGEIVYTSLDFRGTAFLRYKTGDIGSLQTGPCPYCGAKTPRINPAITRSSDILSIQHTKIKGMFVDMNAVAAVLSSNQFIVDWQIVLEKKDKYDLDEVVLSVALHENADKNHAKEEILREFVSYFHVTPKIVLVSKEELRKRLEMETALKEKRIVDNRNIEKKRK